MPSNKNFFGRCEVCDETSRGYHFGAIVCRACAAFFRRTVALGLKYKCRFDGHCLINKSVRCMCRECRYKRCLEVGMRTNAVQFNRDTIGQRPRRRKSVIIDNWPSSSWKPPPITAPPDPSQHDIMIAKINSIFECALANDKADKMPALNVMLQGYHQLLLQRNMLHSNAAIQPLRTDMSFEEQERRLRLNYEILLFERFWKHFLKLERAYTTFKQLGDDVNDDRVVLFNNHIAQQECCLPILANLSNMDLADFKRLFSTSLELNRHSILSPLKRLKPTEHEFIAVCGHMLWTAPGERGVSVETHNVGREARFLIFSELHRHYIEQLNLYNYAPRMGELMALVSAVEVI
uniref:Nuclear receptor domain-containing protein n=1 Tax=Ascaris lumbricoides TaxID=6252 RepID=A0A0M3HZQ5_ASCLU